MPLYLNFMVVLQNPIFIDANKYYMLSGCSLESLDRFAGSGYSVGGHKVSVS